MTTIIRTRRGVEVLIDPETLDIIGGRSVFLRNGYPSVWLGGKRKIQYLHRLVMDAPKGVQVDHIDGNKLDCRRTNLRLCTHAGNMRNSRMRKNNTSGRKGVSWHRRYGKWQAQIRVNGKLIFLGYFECLDAAAAAYDNAAIEHHRDFALTNEMACHD